MTIPNSLANLSGSLQLSLLDENFTYLDDLPKFVTGMIMMWSGSIATIPSGWLLCNGSNGTPDLRNRFIIGAHSDNAEVANTTITGSNTQTGGSKDAIVVSHTHTGITGGQSVGHTHSMPNQGSASANSTGSGAGTFNGAATSYNTGGVSNDHNHSFTTDSTGSSGTNANLVPYFALAYIMKV